MKAPFKKNMYYEFALVSFVSPNDLVESIEDGAQLNEIWLALKKMFPSESMVWCVHDFDGQEHKCQILHQNDANPHKKVRIHSHVPNHSGFKLFGIVTRVKFWANFEVTHKFWYQLSNFPWCLKSFNSGLFFLLNFPSTKNLNEFWSELSNLQIFFYLNSVVELPACFKMYTYIFGYLNRLE